MLKFSKIHVPETARMNDHRVLAGPTDPLLSQSDKGPGRTLSVPLLAYPGAFGSVVATR